MKTQTISTTTKTTSEAIDKAFTATRQAKRQADLEHAESARATMTIDLEPDAYGIIAMASVINGCSMKEALEMFLHHTDHLCDWRNEGCAVD